MKKVLKYIGCSLLGAFLLGTLLFAYISSAQKRKELVCNRIDIKVMDSAELSFVSPAEIQSFLNRKKVKYIGEKLDSIDLVRIERLVDTRTAVAKSEAFTTKDGVLNITLTQKEPVIRFQSSNQGYYADEDGNIFPLQKNHTAHVPVINGNIPKADFSREAGEELGKEGQEWVRNILRLEAYMKKAGWDGNFVQIYVRRDGNLILIPREGKEQFIFGPPEKFEEKFSRMKSYYTGVRPSKEEGYYSTVDLRYRKQLVCTK